MRRLPHLPTMFLRSRDCVPLPFLLQQIRHPAPPSNESFRQGQGSGPQCAREPQAIPGPVQVHQRFQQIRGHIWRPQPRNPEIAPFSLRLLRVYQSPHFLFLSPSFVLLFLFLPSFSLFISLCLFLSRFYFLSILNTTLYCKLLHTNQ